MKFNSSDSQNSATLDLSDFEQLIGYRFSNTALLERALTHSSWAREQLSAGEEAKLILIHNESFEFVGDSILGCIVAVFLFNSHSHRTEGELSQMKHRLVSSQSLSRAAKSLSIGAALRLGRGEEKSGGRRKRAILADALEAVVAAVYFDGGIDAATQFVQRALGRELAGANPELAKAADYKTKLQELLQSHHLNPPEYKTVEIQGPPHARQFQVELTLDEGLPQLRGSGRTIKAAETDAAKQALKVLSTEDMLHR